jgi:hypothetical protein
MTTRPQTFSFRFKVCGNSCDSIAIPSHSLCLRGLSLIAVARSLAWKLGGIVIDCYPLTHFFPASRGSSPWHTGSEEAAATLALEAYRSALVHNLHEEVFACSLLAWLTATPSTTGGSSVTQGGHPVRSSVVVAAAVLLGQVHPWLKSLRVFLF